MHATDASRHQDRLPGTRCVTSGLGLVLALLSAPAVADATGRTIRAKVVDIRSDDGVVACALFRSARGFPARARDSAAVTATAEISAGEARCEFRDPPPGTYAIAAMHDANDNGELDTNWLGIPTEGYGFSENAATGRNVPSFQVASFPFDGGEHVLTIRLDY